MRIDLAELPSDPALLQQVVRELADALASKDAEVERLRELIKRLQRSQFGRRSEQLDANQLQLGLEDLEQAVAASDAAQEAPITASIVPRRPARRNRGALPAHLPRIEIVVDVEDKACPCCGGAMHVIGEDRSEMLDVVPAQYRVKVIRRPRYGCRSCEGSVVQVPAPDRPVDGGMATEALIAQVLVAKYSEHLPLYRQAQVFARHGIELDRSTLSLWVGRACWWLAPLYRRLLATILSSTKVFADDTPLPVLDPGRGRTKTGRLWAYAVDDRPWNGPAPPAVAYVYAEDRKSARPATHLAGFAGILQVDGYSGFKRLAGDNVDSSVRLAFCWSHCRRYFYDAHQTTQSRSPSRPCSRSAGSMPSRRRSAAVRPKSAWPHAMSTAVLWLKLSEPGCLLSSSASRASPASPRLSATPCATGTGSACFLRMALSSSTPMPSSVPSDPLL